jgi:hypothetical protein
LKRGHVVPLVVINDMDMRLSILLSDELFMEVSDFKVVCALPLAGSFTRVDGTLDQNDIVFMGVVQSEVHFVRFSVSIFLKRNPKFEQLASDVLLDVGVVALGVRQLVFLLTGFEHVIGDNLDKVGGDKTFLNELVGVDLDLV